MAQRTKRSAPGKPARRKGSAKVTVPIGEKLLLTVEEFAGLIGVGRDTGWRLVMRGEVRSVKVGRYRKIPREAVEEWRRALLASTAA